MRRQRQRINIKHERMTAAFGSAAGSLGLSLHRSKIQLSGDVHGHRVGFAHISGAHGEEAPGYLCRVRYKDGPLGIKLRIQPRMRWISRSASGPRLRRSTVTTGDEQFDKLLFVRTSEPERLLLVLDEKVRRRILDLASGGKLEITDKSISLKEPIKDPNAGMIVQSVRRLVSLAEAVEKSRP